MKLVWQEMQCSLKWGQDGDAVAKIFEAVEEEEEVIWNADRGVWIFGGRRSKRDHSLVEGTSSREHDKSGIFARIAANARQTMSGLIIVCWCVWSFVN